MAVNQKFPQLPPSVVNLLEWLTELREIFTCIHHSITEHQSPTSKIWCLRIWGGADRIIEIKFTIKVMYLNHPETISSKIIFHKTGPWCQKVWGTAVKGHQKKTYEGPGEEIKKGSKSEIQKKSQVQELLSPHNWHVWVQSLTEKLISSSGSRVFIELNLQFPLSPSKHQWILSPLITWFFWWPAPSKGYTEASP